MNSTDENRGFFSCVCRYLWDRPLLWTPERLLFHLQRLLFLSELSGQTSSVCLLCLFRCDHFSHICSLVTAAPKPIPPCAYSITEGSCELSCLAAPSQKALHWHFETIRSISLDLWCLIPPPYMGPAWKCGTPRAEIPWGLLKRQRGNLWSIHSGFSISLKWCHECLLEFVSTALWCEGWSQTGKDLYISF